MVMRDRLVKIVPSSLVTVLAHATRLDSAWHQRYQRVDRVSAASWGQRIRWYSSWRSAWVSLPFNSQSWLAHAGGWRDQRGGKESTLARAWVIYVFKDWNCTAVAAMPLLPAG